MISLHNPPGVQELFSNLHQAIQVSEKYILPEKELDFERQVATLIGSCLSGIIHSAKHCSNNEWQKIEKEWHIIPFTYEKLTRRLDLVSPATEEDFIASLWWMCECGEVEDLNLLKQVKESPPFQTREIDRLIDFTIERITKRFDTLLLSEFQSIGWEKFQQELPLLMETAPGKWVAYRGESRIAIEPSKKEIYKVLKKENYNLNEILVRRIEPLPPPLDLRRYINVVTQEG